MRDSLPAHVVKALANERRLEIMNWLRDPARYFPPQVDGDLVKQGLVDRKDALTRAVHPEELERRLM